MDGFMGLTALPIARGQSEHLKKQNEQTRDPPEKQRKFIPSRLTKSLFHLKTCAESIHSVKDKLPLAYEYLGEISVKNIQKPIRAFRVHLEPAWFSGKLRWKRYPHESDTGMDFNQSYSAKPGRPGSEPKRNTSAGSRKVRSIALVLCVCLGIFGLHRFYAGKNKTAKIQLFSLGGLGIWFLLDLILILVGEFKDAEGRKMRDWI